MLPQIPFRKAAVKRRRILEGLAKPNLSQFKIDLISGFNVSFLDANYQRSYSFPMKLYLSSYLFGTSPNRLAGLIGENKTAAIVLNASDAYDPAKRPQYFAQFSEDLSKLGISSSELDLRHYFEKPELLREELNKFGMLWVAGGNTFVLRRAMRESGLDRLLPDLLTQSELVYAGFSAGVCVLSPSLFGIHLADEPERVPEGYPPAVIWEGLNIIDFYVVPHFRSLHKESAAMENVVDYLRQNALPYYALTDGEAIVIDGKAPEVVGRR